MFFTLVDHRETLEDEFLVSCNQPASRLQTDLLMVLDLGIIVCCGTALDDLVLCILGFLYICASTARLNQSI